ncbi:phospholipase [Paenibacillus selenitireducens]|uniref:Phospholipase n=1 Tax=Paenibacillus selenitireducens TaxID=1324314 RepID=A0A1T2XCS6_9BACL|nr:PHB depolymerase family esterase [Paenibacillus selenitireducens]OPA77572.1 phospholipase [Paenibacillus selenitireducens]
MQQMVSRLQQTVTKTLELNYVVYLPSGYDPSADVKWPMIYFLHGMNQRGDDIELIKKYGIPQNLDAGEELPFIVVCPQCATNSFWPFENESLITLLDNIVNDYHVDENRIYLTGLSMGGFGTWDLAMMHPERFAAIAPICGGSIPGRDLSPLREMPIWTFHGDQDPVVPIQFTQMIVSGLEAMDAKVKFTVYPGVEHDSWTETYRNPALYDWFLEHTREQ